MQESYTTIRGTDLVRSREGRWRSRGGATFALSAIGSTSLLLSRLCPPPPGASVRLVHVLVPPLPEPAGHRRRQHEVVVFPLAPVLVRVVCGPRVDLHAEVQELVAERLGEAQAPGYPQPLVLQEDLH